MIKNLTDRDNFINQNLGLVHTCAHRFIKRGIDYDDLYSAGCVGLIKAADGFDKERGLKFSTYAVPVILGEIKRLFRDGGSIKVSRSLKELSLKLSRERERYIKKNGEEPTIGQLAKILDVTLEQAVEAMDAAVVPISLTSSNDDETKAQIDVKVEIINDRLNEKIVLKDAIEDLDEKDKKLITLRYFKGKTQTETAKVLKMTQVQVSRKEKKILTILREKIK